MRYKIIVITLAVLSLAPPCYALEIESASTETDLQRGKELEQRLKPAERPAEIQEPTKIEGEKRPVKFFVKKIVLEGCKEVDPEAFADLLKKFENRELPLDELDDLSREIQKRYLKIGYLAACFVPSQEVKDGNVTIRVVEAKMGQLKISDHKYFNKERLRYYWTLPEGQPVNYHKLSKSVQLMNENPDRSVRAVLHAGEKPKTTDVLLETKTKFPIHLTSSFDREGVRYTGKEKYGFGLKDNNLLGLDDRFLAGYIFGRNFDGFYAYNKIPVTYFGTSVLLGYSQTKSFPKKEYEPYAIDARSRNCSFLMYQDLFKGDRYLGEIYAGLDAKDKTLRTGSGLSSRDRLRPLRLGGDFALRVLGGAFYINPEISQGVNILGAKRKSELSSNNAKNTFSKFTVSSQYKKPLPLDMQGLLKFETQLSSTRLAPQEEFSLGGIDSVRGYPPGDYMADSAIKASAELLVPALLIPEKVKLLYDDKPLRTRVFGLLFVDYGYGKKRGVSLSEDGERTLISVGAGLRIKFFDMGLLRLEWGFPIGDRSLTEEGDSRFHISFDFES